MGDLRGCFFFPGCQPQSAYSGENIENAANTTQEEQHTWIFIHREQIFIVATADVDVYLFQHEIHCSTFNNPEVKLNPCSIADYLQNIMFDELLRHRFTYLECQGNNTR